MIHTQDYLDCYGTPTAVPVHHNPYEIDELDSPSPVYQPALTCGQCEHFHQSKHPKARLSLWGYCPVLDAERRISNEPCRLYQEDCPF